MISLKQFIAEQLASGFNIARSDMPQIDDQYKFVHFLKSKGVEVTSALRPIVDLKSTQVNIDQDKVRSIKPPFGSIIVAEDGYILDGHHRYFAAKGNGETAINTYTGHVPISTLLSLAKEYLE